MTVISAVVGTSVDNDETGRLVSSMLDGAMGLSTNIVTLEYLRKVSAVYTCNHCDGCGNDGECVVDDELRPVFGDVLKADVLILGTYMKDCVVDDRFHRFFDRLLRQSAHLGLSSKRYVLIIGSDRIGSDVFDAIVEMGEKLDSTGMHRVAQLIWTGDEKTVPEDALSREAYLIGGTLRNNFLDYSSKR